MFIFPLPNISIGDLLFFYKAKTAQQKNRDDDSQMREAISAVSFDYGNAFHVGIIVDEQKGRVIHAAKDGVVVQVLLFQLPSYSPFLSRITKWSKELLVRNLTEAPKFSFTRFWSVSEEFPRTDITRMWVI